jgi:signal transduction histidine kinase
VANRPARSELLADAVPAATIIYAIGLVLLAVSLWNFDREVGSIGLQVGPVLAASINVALSVGVCYAGYRLSRSSLDPDRKPFVAGWSLGGAVVSSGVILFTVVVRQIEGRTVPEPLFAIIVSTALGAIFGVGIGFLYENAREEAERARDAREAMSFTNSMLRHDVLNGLQIMQGHAELVETVDDERLEESGQALTKQVDSLRGLIEEVQAVSDVLLEDAESRPVDLVPILTDAADTARESFAESTVELDLPSTLEAEGTPALKPVFTNLLNNAAQHTPGETRIRVSARREGDRIVVRVADDGPGVPIDQRERIFARGVTADGGDGGLGLHIVDTILDRVGGDIHVEDSDLGGAAFVVDLPASDARGHPSG